MGQTVNIVARCTAHRRSHPDLVTVEFARIPRVELDNLERDLIHDQQGRGAALRNVTHARGSDLVESDLDLVVTRDYQHVWLVDGEEIPDTNERVEQPQLRQDRRANYGRLLDNQHGETARFLGRLYVQMFIPRPRATEMTFWAASAMPSTNRSVAPRLIAVSINKMETLVIGYHKEDPELLWAFMNVSKSVLIDAFGSVEDFARLREDWLYVREAGYESGGGDVLGLHVEGAEELLNLLFDPSHDGVRDGASELNLRLMRKGPTLQWRSHCFDLADHLLEPLPFELWGESSS